MRVSLIAANVKNLMAIDDKVFVSCDCSMSVDLRYANGYVTYSFHRLPAVLRKTILLNISTHYK